MLLHIYFIFIYLLIFGIDFGEQFDALACKGTCDYCREPSKVTKAVAQAKTGSSFGRSNRSNSYYRYEQNKQKRKEKEKKKRDKEKKRREERKADVLIVLRVIKLSTQQKEVSIILWMNSKSTTTSIQGTRTRGRSTRKACRSQSTLALWSQRFSLSSHLIFCFVFGLFSEERMIPTEADFSVFF